MAPNMPEAFEAHFGVPMAGAVLNALNIRLDAETIAFILEHGEAKVLITDSEFAAGRSAARWRCSTTSRWSSTSPTRPAPGGERLGAIDYEAFLAGGDPDFAGVPAARRMGRDRAQLHLGHHRQSQGRRLSPSRRLSERDRQHPRLGHAAAPGLSVDPADVPLQRLVLSVDRDGARRAPMSACAGSRPAAIYDAIERERRDASVRRADRHEHAAQRAATPRHQLPRPVEMMTAGAAPPAAVIQGMEGLGFQDHPCLRPDRGVRAVGGVRLARRMGRARRPTSARGSRRARASAIRCSKG